MSDYWEGEARPALRAHVSGFESDRLDEVLALLERPAWHADAACRGMDPDLFYPGLGANRDLVHARQVCTGCRVRVECLEDALARGDKWGVWGGLSERERRRLRRERRLAA